MTCDRLVCANCSGPVSEGRCPVCRATRGRLHPHGLFSGLTPTALLVLLLALVAFALVVQHAMG